MTLSRARFSFWHVTALTAFALLSPVGLFGQATTFGNIVGRVTDPTGLAVPHAAVKATNADNGSTREVLTDASGEYAVRSINPGFYNVEVTASGFSKQASERIKLDVAQSVTQDFHLAVGQVSEQVSVAATAPLLQTETGTVGTVVENAEVEELPLNGRNFNDLTRLVPGAVRGANAGAETIQGETFSVQGTRSDDNYYSLDGMYNNGTFFKTVAIHPSVDAIQEFKVQQNTSAVYGAAAGANIDIAIKSGTNTLHGTVFEFLRNDKLDARDYFSESKPPYRRNQFGFTLGGPVWVPHVYHGKNKTFWFFNYEGLRSTRGNTQFITVPTPAMVAGDLSHTLTGAVAPTVYNPFSGRVSNGVVVRDPFPGNIIPTNLIKPYSKAYADFWFPTTLLPGTPDFLNTLKNSETDNQINARIDQKIGQKNNFYGRVSWSDLDQISPASMPKAFETTFNKYRGVSLNDTHVFSPTTILSLKAGYLRNSLGQGPAEHFIDVYRNAGLTNTPTNFRSFDYPINFGISGFDGPGLGNLVNGPDAIWQSTAMITKVMGKHTFTAGYDYTRLRIFHDSVFSSFNYDNVPTADPQNVANTGQSMASFLLGLPSTANRIVGQTDLDLRQDLHHIYLQDDIKASSRLTVNLGIRWEYNQWPHHIRGRLSGFDTLTGQLFWASTNPVTGQGPNVRPEIADPRYRNFAPRVGLAYRVSEKTVIRSAFGIFYNSNFSWEWSDSRGGWPFSVSDNLSGLNIGSSLTPTESLFQSFDPSKVTPQNQHTVSRDVKTPSVQKWNFGVEHQLTKDLLLELNYQGSHGVHLGSFLSTNDPPPGPGDPELRRPFPAANGAFSELKHIATSKYNALTAKVEKRFSGGFGILGSYAWGKLIDLNSQFGGTSPQNNACIRCDLGLSDLDQRHVFNASYIWVLPFGKGMHGLAKQAIAGWEISGITTFETGRTYGIGINFDNANVGARGNFQRPDLVGNPFPSGFQQGAGPGSLWFDPRAFAVAPRYQFGNLGRNTFHGPDFRNTDLGIFKNFPIQEAVKIQFRAEFFNILNDTNFGNPDGTLGDNNFGTITGMASNQREIQFGLKVIF